ncbi:TY1B-NL2, partial [Symbiodinium sp. CCMP2592]
VGKSGKYHIATFHEEQHAIEEEMQAILSGLDQASGITMTNDVFKTSTEDEIQKWVHAANGELNNMDKWQAGTPSSWNTLRQDLGLRETDELPEIRPSKLVNVQKPVVMEEDIKNRAESAKKHAELKSWKARVRILGVGISKTHRRTQRKRMHLATSDVKAHA